MGAMRHQDDRETTTHAAVAEACEKACRAYEEMGLRDHPEYAKIKAWLDNYRKGNHHEAKS